MDTARYVVALFLVCALPPILLFWPIVHGFIGFWRRIGPFWTYVPLLTGIVVGVYFLFEAREALLAVEFGTRWPLVALGVACLVLSSWFRVLVQRALPTATLMGLPEIAPERHGTELITTGVFARVRHPRYAQFTVGLLGWALFCNHLALYGVFILWVAAVWVIVVFEERELRQRFGTAYEDYARRVPRFFPRLGAAPPGEARDET